VRLDSTPVAAAMHGPAADVETAAVAQVAGKREAPGRGVSRVDGQVILVTTGFRGGYNCLSTTSRGAI